MLANLLVVRRRVIVSLSKFASEPTHQQVWLVIVSTLAAFNIRKAKDEFGNEAEISDDYDVYGLVQYVCFSFIHSSNQ